MSEVLLELAREEDKAIRLGQPQAHKTSPAAFIKQALSLEDEQYVHRLLSI